jgi:hypothetical protein
MSLWDNFKGLFDRAAEHRIDHFLDPTAVTPPKEQVTAKADVHYFRLKVAEMFLSKQVAWFQNLYPAVHSLVRCTFDNKDVEIPHVADLTRLGIQPSGGQGDLVARNFVICPTLPFNGGTVSLTAGLIALTGENYLARFLKTLSGFANLLTVPQVSAALAVAQPLADGMQELCGAGNGRMHLGYLNTYNAPQLKSGFVAVVRATARQLDPRMLRVQDGQLYQQAGGHLERLSGVDYMLFEIEVFGDRDDWRSMTTINTPFRTAMELLQAGHIAPADEALNQAVLATMLARELTGAHRRLVIAELKQKYKEAAKQFDVSGVAPASAEVSLESIMKTAPQPESVAGQGPITFAEAFGDLLSARRN